MEHSTVQDLPWDTKYKTQFNGHIAPRGGAKSAFGAAPLPGLILALRTLFDPAAADGLGASYELRLADQRFHARVADGQLEVARGSAEQPDATIETDTGTLSGLLWHRRRLPDALRSGDVEIEGSRPAVERFLRLFPLPAAR